MTISLECILMISARDYCEMYSKELTDYMAVGVHFDDETIRGFAEIVPDEAEVVVNFHFSTAATAHGPSWAATGESTYGSMRMDEGESAFYYTASGVALILK